jgi:hypothetical protein
MGRRKRRGLLTEKFRADTSQKMNISEADKCRDTPPVHPSDVSNAFDQSSMMEERRVIHYSQAQDKPDNNPISLPDQRAVYHPET